MTLPTVRQCCGCVDLILGGKILGWLGIVGGVLNILNGFRYPQYFLGGVATVAINVCWLYGIKNNRPAYLLLNVVLSAIMVVLLYINDVFLLFAMMLAASASEMPLYVEDVPIAVWVILIILITLLATYIFVVQYSVYKAVKERSENQPTVYHQAAQVVSQDAPKGPALC